MVRLVVVLITTVGHRDGLLLLLLSLLSLFSRLFILSLSLFLQHHLLGCLGLNLRCSHRFLVEPNELDPNRSRLAVGFVVRRLLHPLCLPLPCVPLFDEGVRTVRAHVRSFPSHHLLALRTRLLTLARLRTPRRRAPPTSTPTFTTTRARGSSSSALAGPPPLWFGFVAVCIRIRIGGVVRA